MDKGSIEQMLERGEENALLRYTLGALCLKKGLNEEAIGHLERALELDRSHSASWKAYARALQAAGRAEQAMAAYRDGIEVAERRGDLQAVKEMRVFLRRLEGAT